MSALLLLADSQLLFRPDQLPQLLRHCTGQERSTSQPLSAAYIGAANGNRPEFFDLACSALATLFGQPVPCHFIQSESDIPPKPCALVILAGGSVETGWAFLQQQPVRDWLEACRSEADAVFIGVSAGAIHLASGCDPEQPSPCAQTYLGWAPLFVAVHEEGENWPTLQVWREAASSQAFSSLPFAGLPMGGGLWVENDNGKTVGKPGLRLSRP
jgi:cyanophycinase